MKLHILILAVAFCFVFGPQFASAAGDSVSERSTAVQPAPKSGAAAAEAERKDPKKAEKRRAILAMSDRTLGELYRTNPEAKAEIESAVGYAVFDATGINVILYVGVKGKGVAFDNKTKKATYMDMVRAGGGPGVGYKDYRMVFVFKSKSVFDQFTTLGMDAGATADATMKMGGAGKEAAYATSFNPSIKVYQITDRGLLLQANWGGTKFLKDKELNE